MNILVVALGLQLILVDLILGQKSFYYEDRYDFWQTNGVGGSCDRHRSCESIRNSECSRGQCKCLPNYEPSRPWGESVCKGRINATCESDDDCLRPDQVSCIFNTCQNYTKFIESDPAVTKLYRATELGSRCETNEHCRNLHNAICVAGKCECVDGMGKNPVGICEPLDRRFCRWRERCWTDRVYCFGDYCMLPEEFFVESNAQNVSTYAAYHLDDACQTDHHCRNLGNSHCQAGKCTCKKGYDYEGTRCTPIRSFMVARTNEAAVSAFERSLQSCTVDSDCGDKPNLRCLQGKCICSKGFKLEDHQCQEMSETTCSTNDQCPHKTGCYLNTCRYANEFFSSDDGDKYASKDFESVCYTDHHCRNINNTVCFENRCVCKPNYRRIMSYLTDECREFSVKSCTNDRKCRSLDPEAQCVEGFCKSKLELYLNPTSINLDLYVAKDQHQFCTNDRHCRALNNTRCHNKACQCLPGYEVVFHTCQKMIGVNCTTELDCLMPGSHCIFNTCMMIEDFLKLPSNKTSTYTAERVNGFCQTNDHCRKIDNSMCLKSKCTCKPNTGGNYESTECEYYP